MRTSYDGVGEALITALKFDHVVAAAKVIAESMELHIPAKAVLVPVPTATSRVRQRGYDQSVLIATRLRRRYGTERKLLLRRYGQTRQTGSTRAERLQQLHDGFGVIKTKNPPERVLLVDDVLTTGATLEAAAKVLKHAGVKQIDALVFARAQ